MPDPSTDTRSIPACSAIRRASGVELKLEVREGALESDVKSSTRVDVSIIAEAVVALSVPLSRKIILLRPPQSECQSFRLQARLPCLLIPRSAL